jgi:phosphoglycolate phosphatase-like HAD superfamily hydrolase
MALSKIKCIFFDFDGVLADSVALKSKAFFQMYLPYGKDIAEKAAAHHLKQGGISRYEKFRHYHREFLGIEIDAETVATLGKQFSDLVMEEVIRSPLIPGTREFLETCKSAGIKMWVITGTPTPEIEIIASKMNLSDYFEELLGAPPDKISRISEVLSLHPFSPDNFLFIGDSITDYEAAKTHNIPFILREHPDNMLFFKDIEVQRISNFLDHEAVWKG